MAEVSRSLVSHPPGATFVLITFAFVCAGFLVKMAVVPFQFWLADAPAAVAPTPVCAALFSGVMVELGLYAVARLYWLVFSPSLDAAAERAVIFFSSWAPSPRSLARSIVFVGSAINSPSRVQHDQPRRLDGRRFRAFNSDCARRNIRLSRRPRLCEGRPSLEFYCTVAAPWTRPPPRQRTQPQTHRDPLCRGRLSLPPGPPFLHFTDNPKSSTPPSRSTSIGFRPLTLSRKGAMAAAILGRQLYRMGRHPGGDEPRLAAHSHGQGNRRPA